jgi:16S rRNA processing protein RimM
MIPPLKAIGRISGTHGYRGELNIEIKHHEVVKGLNKGNYLFVEFDNKGVPFYIESVSLSGGVLKLKDIETEDDALELVGKKILLEEQSVPQKNQSIYDGLEGFVIKDKQSSYEGVIKAVEEFPQGLMFLVENDGKSNMIPAVEDWIVDISETKKVILMKLPEGLTEI